MHSVTRPWFCLYLGPFCSLQRSFPRLHIWLAYLIYSDLDTDGTRPTPPLRSTLHRAHVHAHTHTCALTHTLPRVCTSSCPHWTLSSFLCSEQDAEPRRRRSLQMVKGWAPASGCCPLLFRAPAASGQPAAERCGDIPSAPPHPPAQSAVPWRPHSPHLSLVITFPPDPSPALAALCPGGLSPASPEAAGQPRP